MAQGTEIAPTGIGVFLKFPEPGRVKTRLAAAVGKDEAASLYRKMVGQIMSQLEKLPPQDFELTAFFDAVRDCRDYQEWLKSDALRFSPQADGDLGTRLVGALNDLLTRHAQAVLIGSDCVELQSRHFVQTRNALSGEVDLVIGPAKDGGYYLIGMKEAHIGIFQSIDWSTERVLDQTLSHARQLGLSTLLLEELSDIDTIEDLHRNQSIINR